MQAVICPMIQGFESWYNEVYIFITDLFWITQRGTNVSHFIVYVRYLSSELLIKNMYSNFIHIPIK